GLCRPGGVAAAVCHNFGRLVVPGWGGGFVVEAGGLYNSCASAILAFYKLLSFAKRFALAPRRGDRHCLVEESQGPVTFFFWKTRWPLGYGAVKHRDQPCRAVAEIYPRRSWGTCRRAIGSITRTRLLLSGV
ncbi:uncharacterized protein TM35_000331650, partial [Trypanosoma theileri]